jgi:ribosomal protein S8
MNNLANMLANIKLGLKTKKLKVRCYSNKFILRILRKLFFEGYIRGVHNENKYIFIYLKYDENFIPIFFDIKIISTSGHRVYFTFLQVLEAYYNNKIYLLTTSKGLFFVHEIVLNNLCLGGEVILFINYF